MKKQISGNLDQRTFDDFTKENLGIYIYCLRDPRDNKTFYVGQGQNDRIFDHFKEVDKYSGDWSEAPSKLLRILDIWRSEEDVEWSIIAHKLDQKVANAVEAASIDLLGESQNGPPLNQNAGPNSTFLDKEALTALSATLVNPSARIGPVFVFPIQKALAEGKDPYQATRSAWYVKQDYQIINPAFAVGIKNNISIASYQINQWEHRTDGKHEFTGIEFPDLLGQNWAKVLTNAKGYWQRGNYLIVEFDGAGKARILRGNPTQSWISL